MVVATPQILRTGFALGEEAGRRPTTATRQLRPRQCHERQLACVAPATAVVLHVDLTLIVALAVYRIPR